MNEMTVHIYTFGYQRSGIPSDPSGHGGGFVFDCRAIENPGLLPGYMAFTGHDPQVISLLDSNAQAQEFYRLTENVVALAVERYTAMRYDSLMVAYGCTGGQHRSVYFAEKLATELRARGVQVTMTHTERRLWP